MDRRYLLFAAFTDTDEFFPLQGARFATEFYILIYRK
jgi:hypothetical protein